MIMFFKGRKRLTLKNISCLYVSDKLGRPNVVREQTRKKASKVTRAVRRAEKAPRTEGFSST